MENKFTPKFENKKPVENFSQEDIHAVFELHPELVSIGSEEEYGKYLGTIFPESKMVFRGDSKNLQTFQYSESKPENTGNLRMGPRLKYGSGIYFSSDNNLAKEFSIQNSGEIYTSLLDCSNFIAFTDRANLINTVKEFFNKETGVTGIDVDNYVKQKQLEGFIVHVQTTPDEFIVGDMKKIHILGSEKDIQNFKHFVENKNS